MKNIITALNRKMKKKIIFSSEKGNLLLFLMALIRDQQGKSLKFDNAQFQECIFLHEEY